MSMTVRRFLARCLAWYGGGDGLFRPGGTPLGGTIRRRIVLATGRLPTCDYYFGARNESADSRVTEIHDVLGKMPSEIILDAETQVVIVRHLPRHWLRWLAGHRERVASIVYFLDDDMPAALRARELPLPYAFRTAWRYASNRRHLARLCDAIWVSTGTLADRYADIGPRLREPAWLPQSGAAQTAAAVYFYHGTWAHRSEIEWLVPVVREVQARVAEAWFEIIGTDKVRRLFRGIPRVRIVHPMSWPDYLAYTVSVRYRVGLAPCLDSDFNRARSHVKVYDITRMGAAGVYSNAPPYAGKIAHGKTGLLLDDRNQDWIAAITALLRAPDECARLQANARNWCESSDSGAPGKLDPARLHSDHRP